MTPAQAKNIAQKYALELGAAVTVLAAAGYVVVSPKQQIADLATEVRTTFVQQRARDSVQDARIGALRDTLTAELRSIREDLNGLALKSCTERPNVYVYAQLRCAERIGRSR